MNDLVRYYMAEHSVKSPCPVCGRQTYGPRDGYSPSGWKPHAKDCWIPDYCRCGSRKRRGFELCKACEIDEAWTTAALEGIEALEVARSGFEELPSECVFCGHSDPPLGLYGGLRQLVAHYGCYVDNEYDKEEARRDTSA